MKSKCGMSENQTIMTTKERKTTKTKQLKNEKSYQPSENQESEKYESILKIRQLG